MPEKPHQILKTEDIDAWEARAIQLSESEVLSFLRTLTGRANRVRSKDLHRVIALEVLRVAGAVQVGQHDPPRWRPVLPSGWLVAEAAQAKREELPDEPETLLVRLTAKGLRLQKSLKRKSNTGERKNTRKSVLQPLLEAYRKHLDVVGAGRAWKDHLPDGPEMRLTLGQKGETVWEPTERSLEAQCVGWVESASSVQMQLFIRLLKAEYRPVSLRSIPEVLALHALRIAGEVQVAQLDDPGQPEVLLARLRDSDLPNDHRFDALKSMLHPHWKGNVGAEGVKILDLPEETEVAPTDATNGRPPTSHDKAFLTPRELSERFGVPYQALRKRLERFRKSNFNGWNQVSDPLPREARYLFQVAAVKPILDELKASSEMSSERPAK